MDRGPKIYSKAHQKLKRWKATVLINSFQIKLAQPIPPDGEMEKKLVGFAK